MFKEVLTGIWPILEKYAPYLAKAIASPVFGPPSTWAVSFLAKAFGIDINKSDPSVLVNSILEDPECNDKLCNLEKSFVEWLNHGEQKFPLPSEAEINIKLKWNNGEIYEKL